MNTTNSNPFNNRDIAAVYEGWYQTTGQRANQREIALLNWLCARFDHFHSILDVGCGTGHFTRWFSEAGARATGLDLSFQMLTEAKSHGDLVYLQGDAIRLPFLSKSFDLVSLITTLEFLPDPPQALVEAMRVARKGIILGVINEQSCLGMHYKHKGGPIWGTARLFTVDQLRRMILDVIGEGTVFVWRTTLWPVWPGSLPLPWGGFIGAAVKLLHEGEDDYVR